MLVTYSLYTVHMYLTLSSTNEKVATESSSQQITISFHTPVHVCMLSNLLFIKIPEQHVSFFFCYHTYIRTFSPVYHCFITGSSWEYYESQTVHILEYHKSRFLSILTNCGIVCSQE